MKMKQVCELTNLTERTIRYYIEKNLINPSASERNDRIYYDFNNEDIDSLSQIAILRKVGFSINPNFGRFDLETKEEKQNAYLDFLVHHRMKDYIYRFFKPLGNVLRIIIMALLLLLIIFSISHIPKTINQEYSGIKYRINSTDTPESTDIHIKGKLYRRLFQKPVFKGSIILSDLEISKDYEVEIYFNAGINDIAILNYFGNKYDKGEVIPDIDAYATIRTNKNFSYLFLNIYEPEGEESKSLQDLVTIAPASNVEEANQIITTHNLDLFYPLNEE